MQRVLDGKSFETELAVGSWQSAGEVMKEIEKDEVFYRESGGGVTFSGGEPLMQPEALQELLELCRIKNYHTAIDTSGHAEPDALQRVMELAAAVRRELGSDVTLGPPDMQTGFDTACIVWDKTDLLCSLVENPDAVKRLASKCARLLRSFIAAYRR